MSTVSYFNAKNGGIFFTPLPLFTVKRGQVINLINMAKY